MVSFANDYAEGAHPQVLARLAETNLEQLPGYGTDRYSASAAEKIRAACGCPAADVYFLAGGTQTNLVVISAMLRGYQGVVAAETGHVSLHEAGAVEASGHKVLTIPGREGKLDPAAVRAYLEAFYADENHAHMVFPGMVYISYPTEYGTLYTRTELAALHEACGAYGIPLFIDGARLGYGLASPAADVTLEALAALCDVFYIGGTKVGALLGEAVVFPRGNTPPQFLTTVKQRGALLAKGRAVGVQFDALFTDGLYLQISRHAVETAEALKALLHRKGIPFFLESPTNQQFVILEDARLAELAQHVSYSFWEKYDDTHTVVRLAVSWATTAEQLAELEKWL